MQKTILKLWDPILLAVEKKSPTKFEDKIKAIRTSPKVSIRTTIKQTIMPPIALNLIKPKISYSFGDIYIDNRK